MWKDCLFATGVVFALTGFGSVPEVTLVPRPREIALQDGFTERTNETVVTDRSVPSEGYRMKVSADGMAEILWTNPSEPRDFGDFRSRIERHRRRLIGMGVNCQPLE